MNTAVSTYLEKRGIAGPWQLEGETSGKFAAAVVIPALGEFQSLFATLAGLAANPPELQERTLVIVVVNNRAEASAADRADNRETLAELRRPGPARPVRLAWVDAASPGVELPAGDGVGLARKIGFDLALPLVTASDGFCASLDADTLIRSDYLPALFRHFASHPAGAAVLPFCHQEGGTGEQTAAIERYELYLRGHLLGLTLAGSPYAYHSLGSALAFRCAAYLKCGGMNRRLAGEDFYLLQQLAKNGGVAQLTGTVVHPSARTSRRVPYGTGDRVSRLLEGEQTAVRCYPAACYRALKFWLELVAGQPETSGEKLLDILAEEESAAAEFLFSAGFVSIWSKLLRNHPTKSQRMRAFHTWFDALATLRFIHQLCIGPYRPGTAEEIMPDLLQFAGLPQVTGLGRQLALLRQRQTGEPAPWPDQTVDRANVAPGGIGHD
jgi:hypothetical protein